MKVVLLKEVQGIGAPGTVKDVADGYARNFLLPRKLATPATAGALKQVDQLNAANERKQAKIEAEAAALAQQIEGQEVTFKVRAGEEGRMYGSVTNADVAEVLSRQIGQEVDRRKVVLEEPIHMLGSFDVRVRLTANQVPTVKVLVEAES